MARLTTDVPSKESGSVRKRSHAERDSEDVLLLQGQGHSALGERILMRVLRLLFVGIVLDCFRERRRRGHVKKTDGRAESGDISAASCVRHLGERYYGPLLMFVVTLCVVFARITAEDFSWDRIPSGEETHYAVLGVSRKADTLAIKKAFKAVALAWHPDKNPGCDSCAERFAHISKAHETLSTPEKRKAYDEQRIPEEALAAANSVDLTADNFQLLVSRSNEVWYVQAYDPNNPACRAFHPLWEEASTHFEGLAHFGRVDIEKNKQYWHFLPHRVVLPPIVWRFARGRDPEIYTPDYMKIHMSGRAFMKYAVAAFPEVRRLDTAEELQSWWAQGLHGSATKVLIVRGPNAKDVGRPYMELLRMAHVWGEFWRFGMTSAQVAKQVLKKTLDAPRGTSWRLVVRAGGSSDEPKTLAAPSLEHVPGVIQELAIKATTERVPPMTVRNHDQLCGVASKSPTSRAFCLVLVDAVDGSAAVAKALTEVESSRQAYAKELSAAEDVESLHIQPVRIMTTPSHFPWNPPAAGAPFAAIWEQARRAPAFLIELETRRVGTVRTTSFAEIFQQVAYGDVAFHELPEHVPLIGSLPDPEAGFRQELAGAMSNAAGVVIVLLVAVLLAILPELSPSARCGTLLAAGALLMAICPPLCRGMLAILL